MPKLLKGSVIFNLCLIAVFILAIVLSLGYPGRAKMAPFVVAVPGVLVSLFNLGAELRAGLRERAKAAQASSGPAGSEPDSSPAEGKKGELWAELNPFAWITGLFVMLWVIGFMAAIPIYLFLYLKVRSKEKLVFSIIFSLVACGVLYLFFVQLLKVPLYNGIIFENLS